MIDDDGDGVYTSSWVTEGAKKAVAFTNRLYQEGYMAKGWNENDMGKKQDQFMQGKVGMIEAHAWYNTILKGFIEKNSAADNKMTIEEASEKIAMFAPPKGPDGYYGIASNPNFWTVTCLNAHMSEKERDAALSLIDFMFSEEGEELFTYGLEGTHYTVNDDGEKELIQEQDSSGFNKLLEDRDSAFIISSVTNWSRSYLSPFATNSEKIVSTLEKAKEYNRFADYPFVQPDSYIKSWKSLADHAETTFFNAVLEKDYYTAGQYSEKLPTTYEELCKFNDSFEEFWAEYLERYLEQMGGRKMTEDYNEAIKNAVKVAH